ncbi:hypothetical protein F511_24673 [Dorcoceras hygrometricum]|uniref:Uncharacterized protein n=1 Tax=Dorcoceras hygrometricum TaxID=472368 RepID=A0A2Z7DDD9_9LAMI|nr:hypothetical protein F511_24673 [Dorcoceras hygrometricum]
MSCWSIAELTAGALACSDERSVSVVLNAGEVRLVALGSPGETLSIDTIWRLDSLEWRIAFQQ